MQRHYLPLSAALLLGLFALASCSNELPDLSKFQFSSPGVLQNPQLDAADAEADSDTETPLDDTNGTDAYAKADGSDAASDGADGDVVPPDGTNDLAADADAAADGDVADLDVADGDAAATDGDGHDSDGDVGSDDADGDVADAAAADTSEPCLTLACDDDNPCTDDSCADGACVHLANTQTCTDDDACTSGDICADKVCGSGAPTLCEDGNACTSDGCESSSGCLYLALATTCSDGDACTSEDVCQAGSCVHAGLLGCDDKNPCTTDSCESIGGCVHLATAGTCSDGSVCTTGDFCSGGKCAAGQAISCSDGKFCTTDSCDPTTGCFNVDTTGPCDDGNNCNSGDACANGACSGVGGVSCDDGNPCTTDGCELVGGCTHSAAVDGSACVNASCGVGGWQAASTCLNSSCSVTPTGADCDDKLPCTADSCNALQGCLHSDNTALCDDGDACTKDDVCGGGLCAGVAISCNDGYLCTTDGCNSASGCTHDDNALSCNDASPCTTNDNCQGGTCVGGGTLSCDDNNPCTTDSCPNAGGCVHDNNTAPCDDGKACTTPDTCSGGGCVGSSVDSLCDDNQVCTDDTCNPASGDATTGCKFTANNATACTDGKTCTTDACSGGSCVSTAVNANCTDNQVCTDDTCNPASGDATTGCKFTANNANVCTDGKTCTTDACSVGSCVSTPVNANCTDNQACTDDTCNPASGDATTGCKFTANNANACTDGKSCTTDACSGGSCVSTPVNANCTDNQVCTDDTCNPASGDATTGCKFTNNTAACTDNDVCTSGDVCSGGACTHSPVVCSTNATCGNPGGCVCNPGFTGDGTTCSCGGIVNTTTIGGVSKDVCAYDYPVWGVRPLSPNTFTANGDGTVSDSQTKLMWQQTASSTYYLWPAAVAYCDGLTLGGHDDWRLPTVAEGESLFDYTLGEPEISAPYFPNAAKVFYWTSIDANAGLTPGWSAKWYVSLELSGGVDFGNVDGANYVRCVRSTGSFTPPATRFTVNGSGASAMVRDNATGLFWQQTVTPNSGSLYMWSAAAAAGSAQQFCQNLSLGGYTTGWRVPTIRELFSLVDRKVSAPAVDTTVFSDTQPYGQFWSATPRYDAYYAGYADGLSFYAGSPVFESIAIQGMGVRCVHAGCTGNAECDDGNVCTTDSCAVATGVCVHNNNSIACNDGKSCTTSDACSGGVCVGTAVNSNCNDSNACTDDTCNPSIGDATTGCKFTNNTVACTDNDACTTGDVCTGGACTHTPVVCGSSNATCANPTGCVCNSGFSGDGATCTCGGIVNATTIGGLSKNICAYDYPVWGSRPDSPATYLANGDGTVNDSQTKLMWQQVTDGNTYTWANAGTYCDGLTLAGHDDWRLPTVAEAESLYDYTKAGPAINAAAFPGAAAASYWTSVAYIGVAGYVHSVSLVAGQSYLQETATTSNRVRCVRAIAPASPPVSRFTVSGTNPNATVLDNATALVWQRTEPASGYPWSASAAVGSAQAYCNALSLNGLGSGWRLPTARELAGILDRTHFNPLLDSTAFSTATGPSPGYWAATPLAGSGNAWFVRFDAGWNATFDPPNAFAVRCVHDNSCAPSCNDGNPCTWDTCTQGTCSHVNNTIACDDGKSCTTPDVCSGGACVGTAVNSSCNDSNVCTDDTCNASTGAAVTGCLFTNNNANACTDSRTCTTDACVSGGCVSTKVNATCDDGNSCTTDTCDPNSGSANAASGCYSTTLVDGASCTDGNACTVSDTCASGSCVIGQATVWTQTYGGSGDDEAYALTPTSDGGIALVGVTSSYGAGGNDAWVVRTDGAGNKLWDKTYGGTGSDSVRAVVQTQDGGFLLGGSTSSKGAGGGDAWIIKVDSTGTMSWDATYGTAADDGADAIASTPDGGYVVSGTRSGFWLLRLSSDGGRVWEQSYGGTDGALDVKAVGGGFVLGGSASSGGKKYLRLIRTDGNGQTLWDRMYGTGYGYAYGYGVAVMSDGGFAVCGSAESSAGIVVRTDSLGNSIWTFSTGARPEALAVAPDNSLFVAGYNASDGKAWHARLSPSGSKIWEATPGSPALGESRAIRLDGASNVLFASTKNAGGVNGYDFYLLRTDLWGATNCGASGQCALNTTATCNDNDQCTQDLCSAGTCSHPFWPTSTPCDDGNACKTGETCNASHVCTGASNVSNGTACDDGDACKSGEACTSGVCVAGSSVTCATNASCNSSVGCVCNAGYWGSGISGGSCACGGTVTAINTASGSKNVCAYDYPVWGNRAISPSTFNRNGDGTVSDSQTQLMWQQVTSGASSWSSAKLSCDGLSLAGYDDWRLATVAEGESLLDYTLGSPEISATAFSGEPAAFYWASASYAANNIYSWFISLSQTDGVDFGSVNDVYRARCVRSNTALPPPATRFTVSGTSPSATVLDNATGLTWQQTLSASSYNWSASGVAGSAQAYCAALSLGAYTNGWRVPTERELFGLVDRSVSGPAINSTAFPSTPNTGFWSATPRILSGAWYVNFSDGSAFYNDVTNPAPRVRCVH